MEPGEIVVVLAGATLLAGSWTVVAANDTVPGWEAALFEAVNGLPGVIWPVVWVPMQLGSVGGSLVVVGVTALVTRSARLTVAVLVAAQAAYWTAKVIKTTVSRGRPHDLLADVKLREHAAGLGYVSGHAAVAFALAAALAPSIPRRWRPAAVAAAVTVAFARVHGGVHLPLDVVGGAGIGLLFGTLSRWAFGLGGEGLPVRRI